MKVSEIYGTGQYLKAIDLAGRGPSTVRIVDINAESFQDDGGSPKLILSFEGCRKKLAVNKTNAAILADRYGDDTEAWLGKRVRLSVHKVSYNGRLVDGIAVEPLDGPPLQVERTSPTGGATFPEDPPAQAPRRAPAAEESAWPGEMPF